MTFFQSLALVILLAGSLLHVPSQARADDTLVVLADSDEVLVLTEQLSVLRDPTGTLTLDDVRSEPLRARFERHPPKTLTRGFDHSAFWIRGRLLQHQQGQARWFLDVGYPLLDHVDLYVEGPRGVVAQHTGDHHPEEQRPTRVRTFVFPLDLAGEVPHTFWLRVQTSGSVQVPLTLRTDGNLAADVSESMFGWGAFFGLVMVMALYNFFVFLTLRERSYFYYSVWASSYALGIGCLNGFAHHLFWTSSSFVADRAMLFFSTLALAVAHYFQRSFLDTQQSMPRADRVAAVLGALGLGLTILLPVLPYTFSGIALILYGLATWTSLLVVGFVSWGRGYRPARNFALSWTVTLVGLIVFSLAKLGVLPRTWLTEQMAPIGLALTVLLLSFALADRINLLKQEKLEAQRAAIEGLRRVDRLKDDFLANTSHELRTPLHGIIGLGEAMLEAPEQLSAAQEHSIRMTVGCATRLSSLVDDILDFSKIRHADLELELVPLDLASVVDLVLALTKPLLKDRGVVLRASIPEQLPRVVADEKRLQQILHNLIGNAVKFTPRGEITVSALEVSLPPGVPGVEVAVTDSGVGIAQDEMERVFEPFEQGNQESVSHGGTGLGLAITKKLVELHGGTVRVESEVDHGSRFAFTLRATLEAATPRGPELSGVRIQSEHGEHADSEARAYVQALRSIPPEGVAPQARVLAVDDDPVNLAVLAGQLSPEGFAIETAQSGAEALARIASVPGERPFDIVLLDVMMPGMSGFEVCKRLRASFPREALPVLFLTARTQVNDLVHGFEVGANDYLCKPFSKPELLARVRAHLGVASAKGENPLLIGRKAD